MNLGSKKTAWIGTVIIGAIIGALNLGH